MANYNKIILVGRVGRDAVLRATPKGLQVADVNVAVNDLAKKKADGSYETEWYRVSVFGEQAERLVPRLLKGALVLVEGRLSIRTYIDKNQQHRYSPEVSNSRVVVLAAPGGQSAGAQREVQTYDELEQSPDINSDDIPF
jgi:single-strand DNA-binding protein